MLYTTIQMSQGSSIHNVVIVGAHLISTLLLFLYILVFTCRACNKKKDSCPSDYLQKVNENHERFSCAIKKNSCLDITLPDVQLRNLARTTCSYVQNIKLPW